MLNILAHYSHLPGDRELVFKSLCSLLAENPAGLSWSGFGPEEWALFGKMAGQEGVGSIVYHQLKLDPQSYQLAAFDPQVYKVLGYSEAVIAVRNAVLFKQLERIVRTLAAVKIPVVLLKGADLARSLYPNQSMRPMTDLDLLVPQPYFQQALELVNRLGYHSYLPEASPGLDRLLSHHAHLRSTSVPATLLELHWSLLGTPAFRYTVSMEWFWENLEACQAYSITAHQEGESVVSCLNPTANLLYLSAHQMLQHGGERTSLHWLLDLHRLVQRRQADIDWQNLAHQALRFGWGRALAVALGQTHACFGTPLPDGLLEALEAEAGAHDALVDLKSEQAPTRILNEWKKLSSLKTRGRIQLFFTLLAPSPAYMRWRYRPQPEWVWPLYYFYRWLDIAVDGVKTFIHILIRSGRR